MRRNQTTLIFFLLPLLLAVGPSFTARGVAFEKRQIWLGNVKITVEVANNDERRLQGLMFRESLSPHQGMLFLFEREQELSFWMKNTRIPLAIGFFDRNRSLIEVLEMEPAQSNENIPQYRCSRPAQYALEMNKGWFARNHISPGVTWKWADKAVKGKMAPTKVEP